MKIEENVQFTLLRSIYASHAHEQLELDAVIANSGLLVADPSRNNRRSAYARDIHMPDASLIPSWYDRIRSPTRSSPWSVIEVSIEMGLCPGCIDLRRMQSWLTRIPIVVMLRHFVPTCLNLNLTAHGEQSGKWYLNWHDHYWSMYTINFIQDKIFL